jgi:predicted DNA-binding protein (MmcQ/YjbR family)
VSIEWVRRYCLSLPDTTENVQWGNDLVFKIAGKMFAIVTLEPGDMWMSFKCTPEDFAELTERPAVIPAPYLARAQWVALERENALSVSEIKRLVRQSYELVRARLPKKSQDELKQRKAVPKHRHPRVRTR